MADNNFVIKSLKEKYLQPPSSLPYNLNQDPVYIKEMLRSSMFSIKKSINLLVNKTKNGFFIEAGALDGQFLSNTLWLEQNLNWTGLLIEPDSNNYRFLKNKHRKSWITNTCISDENFPKSIILSTVNKWIKQQEFNWMYRGNSHNINYPFIRNMDKTTEANYQKVQCYPLYSYLKALDVYTIDFLSLDTQGGEFEVLKNIPWDKVNIYIIAVEHTSDIRILDKSLISFMNQLGYILLSISQEPDYVFVKENSQYLKNFPFETVQSKLKRLNLFDNLNEHILDYIYYKTKI